MEIKIDFAHDLDSVILIHKQLFNENNSLFFENLKTKDYYKTFVATHNDRVIAYCIISLIAGEAELINIGTLPEYRGNGIAYKLLMFVLGNIEAEAVFLEVSNINNAAIELYKKCGFEEFAVRKKYYGNSDAILMRKLKK